MKNVNKYSLFLTVVLFVGLTTYSGAFASGKIKILEIGPNKVKAGVGFNVQPNGSSAMWVKTENATKDTVIFWGNTKLATYFQSPNLLTAGVPNELFSKPGKFTIYLIDQQNKQKTNSVSLTVQ